jgi:hypothetical protein
MAKQIICNYCGKPIVKISPVSYSEIMPYGSDYDGNRIEFDLHPKCADEFFKVMNSYCKIGIFAE